MTLIHPSRQPLLPHLKALLPPLGFFLFYAAWVWVFKLLILSFITFFMLPSAARMESGAVALPRFEEITDVLGANELPLIGFSSFLFVAFLRALHPLTSTPMNDIFSPARLKRLFVPGALHGSVFSFGIILAFVLSGLYRVFGFALQADELALALPGFILRIGTVMVFIYCEEFIFRKKILPRIFPNAPNPLVRMGFSVGLTSLLYCLLKMIQFDLGLMQLLTLFILSLNLSFKSWMDGDFVRGAGFWSLILIISQPFFGLPVLGTEFSGILLLKYQGNPEVLGKVASNTADFITGGPQGPLSGLAVQALLVADLARSFLKHKKNLLHPPVRG